MRIPREPPPPSYFEGPFEPLGTSGIGFELGDVRIALAGIDAALEDKLRLRYGPYSAEVSENADVLRVDVAGDERDYFIAPPDRPEFNPVILACDGTRVRYLGYRAAGWFDTLGGRGRLVLSRGEYEPAQNAVENYVRAAVAWQAASRGGALVHAAGAVHHSKGFLFYGESGAGKSTLAACNRRSRIVSDDLSLVLPGAGSRLDLVGSPFRGTFERGEPVRGRFPLAAGFRIVKARAAAVEPVPRLRALSELVGNLPFVAESFDKRPDLFVSVERAFRDVPLAHLHFRKDDESYWDAIERAGR